MTNVGTHIDIDPDAEWRKSVTVYSGKDDLFEYAKWKERSERILNNLDPCVQPTGLLRPEYVVEMRKRSAAYYKKMGDNKRAEEWKILKERIDHFAYLLLFAGVIVGGCLLNKPSEFNTNTGVPTTQQVSQ